MYVTEHEIMRYVLAGEHPGYSEAVNLSRTHAIFSLFLFHKLNCHILIGDSVVVKKFQIIRDGQNDISQNKILNYVRMSG